MVIRLTYHALHDITNLDIPCSLFSAIAEQFFIPEAGQGTGDRGQGTGDRGQGTGDRGQGTGDRGQGTGDRGQGTGSRQRGMVQVAM